MRTLLAIGLVLMIIGGVMILFPTISYPEEHRAKIGPLDFSVTETEHRRLPQQFAYALLGMGAVVTVLAALRWPKGVSA